MTADRSLDPGDGDMRTSEDEGAQLLNSSGGVEKKPDAKSKTLSVSCREKPAGSRSGNGEDSREGCKLDLADVKRAGSPRANDGVCPSAVTGKDESGRTPAMTEGNTAVTRDGVTRVSTTEEPKGAVSRATGREPRPWEGCTCVAMSASAEMPLLADEASTGREESGTTGLAGKSVLNS